MHLYRKLFILFLLEQAFCIGIDNSSSSLSAIKTVDNIRLPNNVSPTLYKIELVADLEGSLIEGKESIDILCSGDTPHIYLHIKNVTINESSVTVSNSGGESIPVVTHDYDVSRDFYIITLENKLQTGQKYTLSLGFTSFLGNDLVGFYRGSYTDKKSGDKRWFAATQFEATYARRAFPCFDEPSLKAEYIISLGRLENMTTISNMPLNRTEPIETKAGYVMDHYDKSVPMSTYLVAFVVSDFVYLESPQNLSKTRFRVWARPDVIEQAKYASDIGPRILSFFEDYFKIGFPLPKQDMIALPDFKSGAMENWGLVTYRESTMLLDDKVSSLSARKAVASVISHELAHQWFGNLVTMKWWSQLWLNEGFASYVEYLGVEKVEPELKLLEDFTVDEIQEVMRLDTLKSSHPISQEVKHPDDISQLFDSISYKKGASVIRMMSHFLTEDTFREGLAYYLKKWQFNNTIQDDLWQCLTEQAHKDKTLSTNMTVKEVMDSWTLQKGFPVLHVNRNYDTKTAEFTPRKFALKGNDEENEVNDKDSTVWWTPVSYASSSHNADCKDTKPKFWLSGNSTVEQIPANESEWFLVNPHQTGFYKVNYDSQNWKLLEKQLTEDYQKIPNVNRAQIVNDVLSLAQASMLPYTDALRIAGYIRNEEDMLPWESFRDSMSYLKNRLKRSHLYGSYKEYIRDLVGNQYNRVGFFEKSNETLQDKQHRVNIISLACSVDHKECVNQAKELFTMWMKNSTENPIPKNVKSSVYCTVIRLGREEEWNFLWKNYLKSDVAHEKNIILGSLGCTRESWLISKYLTMAKLPDSGIRKQDSIRVYRAVSNNEVGCELVLTHIADEWPEFIKYFGKAGLRSFSSVFTSISNQLNSPFDLTKLEAFKEQHHNNLGSVSMSVEQAMERIHGNINWNKNNMEAISQFFARKQY